MYIQFLKKKIALQCKDDKRWYIPNTVETLPHGHYKIQEFEEKMQ